MIERHLHLLARHPGAGDHVADTCRRLAAAWEVIRERDERDVAAQFPLPTRLMH